MGTATKASKPSKQPKSTGKTKSVKNRVRIRLSSFDHRLIDASAEKILSVAKDAKGGKIVGPIPLPIKRKVFCVLRSPHVDKKSREHFEIRTHRRIIDIQDPGPEFASQLSRLDLPAGVDIEVRL